MADTEQLSLDEMISLAEKAEKWEFINGYYWDYMGYTPSPNQLCICLKKEKTLFGIKLDIRVSNYPAALGRSCLIKDERLLKLYEKVEKSYKEAFELTQKQEREEGLKMVRELLKGNLSG